MGKSSRCIIQRMTTRVCSGTLPLLEEAARCLFDAGKPELAQSCLTWYTSTEQRAALQLAQDLARSLEARTRVQHGFRADATPLGAAQIW